MLECYEMVNTILLLVAYDNFMQNFINNLYQIAIDSKKEVKKLLKNINSQLREYDEKKNLNYLMKSVNSKNLLN